ncbi:P-loop containing nucleoside triphosphate hydrolase protein [Gigaspora margarita]|uniref:P-loop containing nucleoside triphosphate hydrolase protein n=1 Tax=Gigaspora margarita TaxID=4874 RepID=A0A8H4EPX8_GIGMA|nr:P-loop containing nucleoside triphosphate hydrolase protein [Gigaspora margarita]
MKTIGFFRIACTAYVAQQIWLQNASIRDNILFGLPYNESRYNQVIKVCALEKDFKYLDSDMSEDACRFSKPDVEFAVDAHTTWMNKCLLGPIMKGRTRILVMHHVRFCLAGATYLITVDNGKIATSSELLGEFLFSRDFETIDSTLTGEPTLFLVNALMMLSTMAVLTAITKGIIYTISGALYAKTSRELKRMDSVSKIPLYSHFTETLIGITTIRAFNASKRFMQNMLLK